MVAKTSVFFLVFFFFIKSAPQRELITQDKCLKLVRYVLLIINKRPQLFGGGRESDMNS